MELEQKLILLSVMALPFLLAVTLHEAGHALSAHLLGDPTPRSQNRLSLNPLRHIDPFGTVVIPLLALFSGIPFLIGYAKPVIINPDNFSNQKRDMIIVSLAGPAGNLIVGLFCAAMARMALASGFGPNDWLVLTMEVGILLNALFMVFNLLPIPPLDGSKVAAAFMSPDMQARYESIAPYGFFILIGLIMVAREVVLVPTYYVAGGMSALFGL